ncbi:MAG: protein kinase [Polyangia bacterium]
MSVSPQPTKFGPFVLERKLAEGGMAEVYLANHIGFGGFEKQVVVKRILPALSMHQDFVNMFLNEARLAARLSHGNVVQVIEAGEIEGRYYIAMEYIDGCDLKPFYDDAERTGDPMPPGIACRIIADLLAGLHYAHTVSDERGRPLGLVHRDVSPQNVLITRTGNVKIVDFGIAKATNAAGQQTRVGQVKGKISYLSPEQAMGKPVDARSDVFACGILLWELVTGQRLFSRSNDMATIMAITDDDRKPVRAVRPELPEELDHVLAQALARPLTDRYPSAAAMQSELEALIRSQGWDADRRALERVMLKRLGLQSVPTLRAVRNPEPDQSEENATMLDSPIVRQALKAKMASRASTASTVAMPAQTLPPPNVHSAATLAPGPPSRPVPSSASRAQLDAHQRLEAPMPTPGATRTPSGMRQSPAVYAQPHNAMVRRVAVASAAAVFVGLVAVLAINWKPPADGPPAVETPAEAFVLLELSEPAVVDIDGHRSRVESREELPLAAGRQLTLSATTIRGVGKEQTRTVSLPPAKAGERMPIKITFAR